MFQGDSDEEEVESFNLVCQAQAKLDVDMGAAGRKTCREAKPWAKRGGDDLMLGF